MEETFQIVVDLNKNGQDVTLYVIPGENNWRIVQDGLELGIIETDGQHNWSWIDSGLPDEAAGIVGDKIESYYM